MINEKILNPIVVSSQFELGESYIYNCTVEDYWSEDQYIIIFNDSHRDFALSSVSPETGVFDEYSECLLSI